MKIELNPDEKVVATIKEGLKQKGGYCPCRLEKRSPIRTLKDSATACYTIREKKPDSAFEKA